MRQGKGDPRFVGNWRLVSFVNIDDKGATTASRFTGGRIMYDAAGQMAAQLTIADRPRLAQRRVRGAACRRLLRLRRLLRRLRRSIRPPRKVTHHVEGSTNPGWPKTDLIRYFEFADGGNTLKLSIRNDGGRTTGTLTWARIR